MKTCFKCQRELPLSGFYKHKQMADGHLNKCKKCTKKDAYQYRQDNLERIKKYDRNRPNAAERNGKFKCAEKERLKDPDARKRRAEIKKRWIENNVIKRAAHIIAGNAVRDGKLIKQPCEVCGEVKVEAHHPDYEKPLGVNWLCTSCHVEIHKKARESERIKIED